MAAAAAAAAAGDETRDAQSGDAADRNKNVRRRRRCLSPVAPLTTFAAARDSKRPALSSSFRCASPAVAIAAVAAVPPPPSPSPPSPPPPSPSPPPLPRRLALVLCGQRRCSSPRGYARASIGQLRARAFCRRLATKLFLFLARSRLSPSHFSSSASIAAALALVCATCIFCSSRRGRNDHSSLFAQEKRRRLRQV